MGETGQMVIAGIPVMFKLSVQVGIAYLRFKRKAKKAARVYERELLAGGIGPGEARELRDMYLESARIVRMGMKRAGITGNNGQSPRW